MLNVVRDGDYEKQDKKGQRSLCRLMNPDLLEKRHGKSIKEGKQPQWRKENGLLVDGH